MNSKQTYITIITQLLNRVNHTYGSRVDANTLLDMDTDLRILSDMVANDIASLGNNGGYSGGGGGGGGGGSGGGGGKRYYNGEKRTDNPLYVQYPEDDQHDVYFGLDDDGYPIYHP
jgi:hypothetical protein